MKTKLKFNLSVILILLMHSLTAQDTTPPSAVTFNPADDATEIPVDNWTFEITFDEDVQLNTSHTRPFIVLRRETGHNVSIIDITVGGATISGNVLSLDFNWDGALDDTPLEENMVYHIEVVPDVIQDLAGNFYAGFEDNDTWNFYTPDTIGPAYNNLSPYDGAIDVLINEVVEIGFSEQTNIGSGTFDLYEGSTLIQSFDINSADVEHSNAASTSRLLANFELLPEKTYNVRVSAGAVEDFTGNPNEGITDAETWTFTTMDDESDPPVIEYFFPENNDPEALLEDIESDGVGFGFDETVIAGTGNIEIRNASDGSLIRSVSMDDPDMYVEGNDVYIYPVTEIPYDTEIEIIVCSTCVTDVLGNSFPGLSSGDWTFTTEVGPLAITSTTPDFNSTNGHVLYLEANFNKNISIVGNPNDRLIEVYRYSDEQFVAFANVEDATATGNLLEVQLAVDIPSGDEVYISIEDGRIQAEEEEFLDVPLSKDFWKFTATWDFVERLEFVPANFSTKNSIDTEIKIVYAEDVKRGYDGSYTLRKYTGSEIIESFDFESELVTINGNEVIFEVNHLLEYNTRYFITMLGYPIRSLNDVPADRFNNNNTFVFTTEPDPALFAQPVTYSPAHQETNVSIDTDISIEFTHPVTLNAHLLFYNRTNGNYIQSVNASTNGTVDGNTATITLDSPLPYDTEVAVRVQEFAFISENHGVIEITDNDTWYFTTEPEPDVTAPSIVSFSPADNSIDVDPGTDLVIEFDEDVFLGNSSFLIKYYDNNVNQYVINYASESISVSGNTITIDPPGALQGDTHYWIQINANTIMDAAGNGFEGILLENRADWDFTTASKQDQVITFDTPTDKTYGDAPFTLTASASSGLPVTFGVVSGPVSISGNEVTILGTGDVSIRADQEGNEEYNGAIVQIRSFTIVKADQVISIDPVSDKLTTDDPFSLTASVNTNLTLTYEITGPANLNGTEVTLTGEAGNVEITVSQSGNDNYNEASESISFAVSEPTKSDQTITFDDIEDKTFGDETFELEATASSGLTVSFNVISGPVSISGNTLTITGAGTAAIAANQAGDSDFNAAPTVERTFEIAKADQTITIAAIDDKLITDGPFEVSATTTSGLGLAYFVTGPASISSTTITLDGAEGSVTLTTEQSGNDNYNSASASISFEVREEQVLALDDAEIRIYPNPAIDYLIVETEDLVNLAIYNLDGQLMKYRKMDNQTIDISNLKSGVYLLEVKSRSGTRRSKIIKAN